LGGAYYLFSNNIYRFLDRIIFSKEKKKKKKILGRSCGGNKVITIIII